MKTVRDCLNKIEALTASDEPKEKKGDRAEPLFQEAISYYLDWLESEAEATDDLDERLRLGGQVGAPLDSLRAQAKERFGLSLEVEEPVRCALGARTAFQPAKERRGIVRRVWGELRLEVLAKERATAKYAAKLPPWLT